MSSRSLAWYARRARRRLVWRVKRRRAHISSLVASRPWPAVRCSGAKQSLLLHVPGGWRAACVPVRDVRVTPCYARVRGCACAGCASVCNPRPSPAAPCGARYVHRDRVGVVASSDEARSSTLWSDALRSLVVPTRGPDGFLLPGAVYVNYLADDNSDGMLRAIARAQVRSVCVCVVCACSLHSLQWCVPPCSRRGHTRARTHTHAHAHTHTRTHIHTAGTSREGSA